MKDLEKIYEERLQLGFLKIAIDARLKAYKQLVEDEQKNLDQADEPLKYMHEKYLFKYKGLVELLEDLKTNY